ncbi:MAG: hypothetical protein J6G98_02455 [Bacilli bacterium]|nr:hypothetical protein [Bacilli bacterium]
MYKFFKKIGLVLLVIGSFIYTEKAALVVKEYDKLMIELKEKASTLNSNVKEAIIKDNNIIPGISGRIVNIDKSYSKMREYSKFDLDLIVYNKTYPKKRLIDNKDKFIIKTQKEEVALIIKIVGIINNEILDIGDNVSFYADSATIKNNKELINKLSKRHTILSNNNKFLKQIIGQKNGFCLTEEYDKEILKKCFKNSDFTIVPSIVLKDNNMYKLNKNLDKGVIILSTMNNYKTVLKYIKNKGYKIVSIDELLSE